MADDKTAAGPTSPSEVEDFERRNTDPTIPIDGADPENIPGPYSNVELKIAAEKHYGVSDDGAATRLRPAHARQKAASGDAISDSDAATNPRLAGQVGEDHGEQARKDARRSAGVPEDRSAKPPTKATTASSNKTQSA